MLIEKSKKNDLKTKKMQEEEYQKRLSREKDVIQEKEKVNKSDNKNLEHWGEYALHSLTSSI